MKIIADRRKYLMTFKKEIIAQCKYKRKQDAQYPNAPPYP